MSQDLSHPWKQWRHLKVDQDLAASWLHRVNCIKKIDVFSLCYGHREGNDASQDQSSFMYKVEHSPTLPAQVSGLFQFCDLEIDSTEDGLAIIRLKQRRGHLWSKKEKRSWWQDLTSWHEKKYGTCPIRASVSYKTQMVGKNKVWTDRVLKIYEKGALNLHRWLCDTTILAPTR